MSYSLIIYDADGTLFDYDSAEIWAFRMMCEDLRIPFTPELHQSYRSVNHAIWKEFEQGTITSGELKPERFRRLFAVNGIDADPTAASPAYLERLGETWFLLEGVLEHLEKVSKQYSLALLTNGLAATQRGRLKASGIGRFFDPVIISEEVGCQKPDPKIFEVLMGKTPYSNKDEVLIIGDSLSSDIAGGVAYGIDTCLYDPGNLYGTIPEGAAVPTCRMGSYGEIEKLLGLD